MGMVWSAAECRRWVVAEYTVAPMMTRTADYDYDLPAERIAQFPLPNRADARLLVVDRQAGTLEHRHVRDLPELLRPGDCLVLNDTKVAPARLVGRRALTGGRWEGLFLSVEASGAWRLLGRTRGKIQPGEEVILQRSDGGDAFALRLVERQADGVWLAEPKLPGATWELLEQAGRTPLPCYIRHGVGREGDIGRYQTVYAQTLGSSAAPTAGLHLTTQLLDRLRGVGVMTARVTLHVGLDTFRPIKADQVEEHPLHSEWCAVSGEAAAAIGAARAAGGRVVAVGTTSVRTLETVAADGAPRAWEGNTRLFVRPGYRFAIVDGLMTNFHLPRSSLLVLVRTFGGDELIRRAYDEAIREEYRFYSYGDAMLIL